jgi:hypothetical protein
MNKKTLFNELKRLRTAYRFVQSCTNVVAAVYFLVTLVIPPAAFQPIE